MNVPSTLFGPKCASVPSNAPTLQRFDALTLQRILACALLLASAGAASPQSLTFNTFAGSTGQGTNDASGAAARFTNPWGVATDSAGNLYVADTDNHTIRKITTGGAVSTFAGAPGSSGTNDGTGSAARFNQPQGVAVDLAGNVFVADTGNYTIRRITPAGAVSTLAGWGGLSGTNNGSGSAARFYEPEGIAVLTNGALIFVADTWNHIIRQVTSNGVVSFFAGSPNTPGTNNGTGTAALFNQPQGIAVDRATNIYVGDTGSHSIRKITSAAVVTTLAGLGGSYGTNDGSGTSARFWAPQGIGLDSSTNLYVADSFNHTLRKITPAGLVTTLAGSGGSFGSADGTGAAARFWQPQSAALDSSGNVFVTDTANSTIRKVTSGGVVTTFAGSAAIGSADATGSSARFTWPAGIAINNASNIFVADAGNGTIRSISTAGVVSTLAGSAGNFGANDGTGSSAIFFNPRGVAADLSGNVYVADTANHTIRKITSGGVVSTLAGQPGTNGVADGAGSSAQFNAPEGIAVDLSGNLYVADTWNHSIRKITPAGVVTTLAGRPRFYGNMDGPSPGHGTNSARFYCPSGIAVDASGNLYVADTRNHTVRMVTSAGVVTTLAGVPGAWGRADGSNTVARFNQPQSIVLDASGNLFVLDSGNHTVRMVAPAGANWAVTTVAGVPNVSGSTDGTGANARFFYPAGLGINNVNSLSVADFGNNTIRSGSSSLNESPAIELPPEDQVVNQGQNATFSAFAAGSPALKYQWLFYGTNLSGATTTAYTVSNAQGSNAGPYSIVVTNSYGAITSTVSLTVIVPPTITNQPQNLTLNQGAAATFTVGVSGTAPFAYQWLLEGGAISAATASSFTIPFADPSNAGHYSVIITNPAGSATSTAALLTVNPVSTRPYISAQPQNLTVSQTSNATFTVTALGSTPLSYQWLFNGGNLSGGMASSYTVTDAQPLKAGPYSVIITNANGAVTSIVATLTVVQPPIISLQPASQLASISNNVTFTVGLSQGTSPAYQWQQNGTPIADATQSSLTFSCVLWSNAGTYSVIVSNSAGSQTSADATLTLQQAAFSFTDNFDSYQLGYLANNNAGPNANASNWWWSLSPTTDNMVTNSTTGVTPHSGANMAGRFGTAYQQDYINLVYRCNAGQPYYGNFLCEWWFYDPYGTADLKKATNFADYMALNSTLPFSATNDAAGSIVNQRMSLGAYNGSGFNVNYYQARIIGGIGYNFGSYWYNTATTRSVGWHHARVLLGIPYSTNAAPVSMYIDDMFNPTVSSATSGFTNGFNLIELNHASSTNGYYDDLTFRAANDPWIIEQPVSQTANPGQAATFKTVAVGTAYQWQFNGNDLANATTSAYTVSSAAATNAGNYACLITGTNGVLSTTPAVLTVLAPPYIVTQPGSLVVTQNQDAAFSVTAVGYAPLSYQWQSNSSPISGATASNYTVTNAQPDDAGSYCVVIANLYGSITSDVATLTVLVPPSITLQPQSQTLLVGNCALFSVAATGSTPLYYQWQWNGAPQTNGIDLTNYTGCVAGNYSVLVSNQAGVKLSDTATLIFTNPPAQPGHFDSLQVLVDGSLQLYMSGTAYTNYVLEITPSFTNWTDLATIPAGANGLFQYNDLSPTTNSLRFYRLRTGP